MKKADIGNLLSEFSSLKNAAKEIEKKLNEAKEKLMQIPDKLWEVSGIGNRYLWNGESGVQWIVPKATSVLDREAALAYSKKNKLPCIVNALDEAVFLELVESGKIPKKDVAQMMLPGTPSKPYLKELTKEPLKEEE